MYVVVIDPRGITKKWQARIDMLELGAGGFEGAERSAIFAVGSIELVFIFIEAGERTLSFPFQKDRTIGRLRDFAECILRSRWVMQPGGNSSLHQQRIDLIPSVVIFFGFGQRLVGVTLGVVELVGLFRDESQSDQGVDDGFTTAESTCKLERLLKGLVGYFEITSVHVDVTEIGEPSDLVSQVAKLFGLRSSVNKHSFSFFGVAELVVGPPHISQRGLRDAGEPLDNGDAASCIGPIEGFVEVRLFLCRPTQVEKCCSFQERITGSVRRCQGAFKQSLRLDVVTPMHLQEAPRAHNVRTSRRVSDGAEPLRLTECLFRLGKPTQTGVGDCLDPVLLHKKILGGRRTRLRGQQTQYILVPSLPGKRSCFEDREPPGPLLAGFMEKTVAYVGFSRSYFRVSFFKCRFCAVEGDIRIAPTRANEEKSAHSNKEGNSPKATSPHATR